MAKVSVIIPTYNSSKTILNCIESIKSQTYTDIECIVVDDASTDNTRQILRDFNIRVIELENNMGPSYARNIGVENAYGEYIAFIDADCVAPSNWVEKHLEFYDEKYCGVTGPYSGSADQSNLSVTIDSYIKSSQPNKNSKFNNCITSNVFLKKADFIKIGGFPLYQYPWEKKYRHGNEDGELAYLLIMKLNKSFLWAEENGVFHHHRSTYISHFKQQHFLAESLIVSLLRYPKMLLLKANGIFTATRIAIVLLVPTTIYFSIHKNGLFLLVALLLTILATIFLKFKERKENSLRIMSTILYPLVSGIAWITGGMIGFIKYSISLPFWLVQNVRRENV